MPKASLVKRVQRRTARVGRLGSVAKIKKSKTRFTVRDIVAGRIRKARASRS